MFFVCILVQAHILQIYTLYYIYRGMLAANPLSFLLWNVEAYPPLMSVFKTDTAPM